MEVLGEAPFSLVQDESVYAKVSQTNDIGTGSLSVEGNGAQYTNCANGAPDAPVNLREMDTFKTQSSLKFTWDDGECNGNSPITSYTISYNDETMEVEGHLHYIEITGLEGGEQYEVSVIASNDIDDSDASNTVTAKTDITLGGVAPPAPVDLDDDHAVRTEDSLTLTWSQVGNGGSPITAYIVTVVPAGEEAT